MGVKSILLVPVWMALAATVSAAPVLQRPVASQLDTRRPETVNEGCPPDWPTCNPDPGVSGPAPVVPEPPLDTGRGTRNRGCPPELPVCGPDAERHGSASEPPEASTQSRHQPG